MGQIESTPISCGVRTLDGVRDASPEIVLYSALKRDGDGSGTRWTRSLAQTPRYGIILFSDRIDRDTKVSKYGYSGTDFAKFIKAKNLGKVRASSVILNPNSGNKIRVWVWELDRKAVLSWFKKTSKTAIPTEVAERQY